MNNKDPIEHVVVLMLENHSFDKMLGTFKELYPDLDGIDPQRPGQNADPGGRVYEQAPTAERQMMLDPHHEVDHVAVQIADGNSGFVKDFSESFPDSTPEARQFIMGYFRRGFLPALHSLAEDFTICDHWHSSLPGPTWPNRFFALSGTSLGRVNMPDDGTHKWDVAGYFQQDQDTIFDRLNERGVHWKVYFHDIPQTTVFTHQRHPSNAARYFYMHEFFDDARGPAWQFPQFSFIEPRYMGWGQNDDHPPHDIMRAEKLIADVYNAIRGNPELWESTLLVVVYDEHGGFYDHVEPPPATPPDAHREEYTFDRLGVRVPALLVSPWVKRGVDHTLFDHTSLLRYLIDKWGLAPLGQRAANANSIAEAITADVPREDTVDRITLAPDQLAAPDPEEEERAFHDLNAHQSALSKLGGYLKTEFVESAPRWYAWLARLLEAIRAALDRLFDWACGARPDIRVSVAEPDRLAHHRDAGPSDNFGRFLMMRKRQAVKHLAAMIRDDSLPEDQRQHALRTLGLVTGRGYHREADGLEHAKGWLERHGH